MGTEHKFFGVTSELEVGCKQTRACQNNFEQNRMAGSVYGRTCRVESTFGTSKCRQCCSTNGCYDGTTNTMDQSSFDQDSEWFDTTNHPRTTHLDNLTKDLYSLNIILRLGNRVYPNYHIVKMLYKIYITCLFYCNKQRRTY